MQSEHEHPFKELLRSGREHWDRSGIPANVRTNFSKAGSCRTLDLGAEIYASETEAKVVCHTCKSRFCPGCGVRATQLWQREIEAALPDIQYVNINLTMPDVFWPYCQEHPGLFHDLAVIAANAIKHWAQSRYGVQLLVLIVPQTFGGLLNFHPHLHVLVSAGGLRDADGLWLPRMQFDQEELMKCWKFALIAYLGRMANVLCTDPERFRTALRLQYRRRWNVFGTEEKPARTGARQSWRKG